ADIIAGLAHLKPQHSFRSRYAYDNLLYVVAGEVAAAMGGASYEELVRREVFEPLGLSRCLVGEWRRDQVGDIAQPHMLKDGHYVVAHADVAIVPATTMAAAGGIRCSLNDMLVWARNWLAPTGEQRAWLSPAQREALWTPQMPMPITQRRRDWDGSHFYAYGYGWRLADVDGAWSISHTGTLSGMYSAMTLLPDRKSGFVVLINGDAGDARTVLTQVLVKHFTAPGQGRSVAWYADYLAAEFADQISPQVGVSIPDTSSRQLVTSGEMSGRLGRYLDPWFGEITICERDGRVVFNAAKSPMLTGDVMRVGTRHLVDWYQDSVDAEAWLSFAKADATTTLTMAKVDPEADFSYDYEDLAFTRVDDCR
ncbi:MAG: serine hydrolase, partial [Gammaproteobacteria bacterium]|nr:serine hydrolase [Gammaproteobacteria bacterium]